MLVLFLAVPTFLTAPTAFPIVDSGQPRAVIAPVAADAPAETKRAVAELQRVVEKMTGAKLRIGAEAGLPTIHVGRDALVERADLNLDELDKDGFVVATVGEDDLVLAGRNPHGTEFAVYRFLQKYGGVRWYLPTELGEVVPSRTSFGVGKLADREEPSFHSRLWSSAARFDHGAWERHNLCRGRYSFHHNLLHVFVPSKLGDSHPEWFPEIDGKRKVPQDDNNHGWQPCLANPEAARYAAQIARESFEKNPDASSFSLGMNDTAVAGFCECAACKALDPTDPTELETPRGMPNYSNRFYTFMNRVAAELSKTHPDKYLGCLAYHVTEPPPTFDVSPRVIPYLTAGRANWTDPAIREGDQRLIRGWCDRVPIVGIYDYYYGSGFISPRIFTGLTEESLQFAHRVGVRAFYAEIYSTWSLDGPKAWVASQMLWDVDQSAAELVEDFCRGLFGKAAPAMREYFQFLEQTWMSRRSGSTVMWAGFFDPTQLELWPPPVCARARALLEKAEQAAADDSDVVEKRVKLYSEGFRQTELWSMVYHGEKNPVSIAAVERFLDAQSELERFNREVIGPNPLHAAPIPFEQRAGNLPGGSILGALLRLSDEPGAEAALRRMASKSSNPDAAMVARAALVMREHPEKSVQVLANPGFESAADKPEAKVDGEAKGTPPDWGAWFRPGTPGELHWTTQAAHSGQRGVELRGAEASCVLQSIPVKPGEMYVASVYVRGKTSGQPESGLLIQWQDAEGKWFSAPKRGDRLPGGRSKDWLRLQTFAKVPAGAGRLVFCVTAYGQKAGESLEIDDAELRRLPR
ncbi:MAG: DUF4838 domain-containing protein [Planctomycetes bacterium]|nr:DUF4838 domain-containing protein [Planctomycetota bacterium]